MLSKIVLRSTALARHQNAALLRERESYLRHLERLGRNRLKQRDASTYLVRVVERLRLTRMRRVRLEEVRLAADSWRRRCRHTRVGGPKGGATFLRYAKAWLRFHGRLVEPQKWNAPRDRRVDLYKRYLQKELS